MLNLSYGFLADPLTDYAESLSKQVLKPQSGRFARSPCTTRHSSRSSASTTAGSSQRVLNRNDRWTSSAFADDFWSCKYTPTQFEALTSSVILRPWFNVYPTQSDCRHAIKSRPRLPSHQRTQDHDTFSLSNQGVPRFRATASLRCRQPPKAG